jgi:hypothetical protein
MRRVGERFEELRRCFVSELRSSKLLMLEVGAVGTERVAMPWWVVVEVKRFNG